MSGGLHGVGVSCVNGLSVWLRLTIRREGKLHTADFIRGVMQNRNIEIVDGFETSPLTVAGATEKRGTEVHFLPDSEIFQQNADFHYDILAKRLRELSFLNNGVRIQLKDERTGKEDDFSGAGGVRGFVEFINTNKTVLHPNVFHALEIATVTKEPMSALKLPCSGTAGSMSRSSASPTTSPSATAEPT